MRLFLLLLAFVAFVIAAVIALVVDTPDGFDVLAAIAVGLGCQVAADLVVER